MASLHTASLGGFSALCGEERSDPRSSAASVDSKSAHLPSSALFQDEERNWRRHYASLTLCLQKMQNGDAAAEDVEAGTEACEGADISLQQLETEARTSPNSQALLQAVRRYQSDFEQARSVFTRLVQQWQRQQLLQGPGSRRGQDTQRTRIPRSAESPFSFASTADSGNHSFDADDADEKALAVHHAGGTLLGESNRLAVESEHVGLAVMGQLRTQRESLISSRSLAQKTYGELQDSRSLLTAMLRQSLFSKLILVAIIVFLSLAIVCVLIHRLLRLVRDV
ncbi:hypothetical protein TGRH88_029850 [Toxoplasma gondii]|uniref:Transmembrane protein n=1 Tax=Toxoplasma gondii TaxID=5811 RepID=A0A7J6K9P0_TOXGO|nr:hypothetical protein TGRH88_029850 [Toxoplasma gondii]